MTRTFTASLRDPDSGRTRTVAITIAAGSLTVRLDPGKPPREDAPHTSTADFTAQRAAIVAALVEGEFANETLSIALGDPSPESNRHRAFWPDDDTEGDRDR